MRIRFSVFLLILVLAFGTFGYAFCAVNDAADQVEFLTKHFDGDISAAEGLEITLKSTYEDHLHWETVFSPAGQKAESTFRFTQSPLYEPWHPAYRVELNTAFTLGYAENSRIPDPHGFAPAYEELIAEAPPGQQTERTVRIADYFDYYPLSGQLVFPKDQHVYWGEAGNNGPNPSSQHGFDIPGSDVYITDKFEEFFRIPVNPEETMHLHITKDADGNVISSGGGSSSSQNYYMDSHAAFTEEEAYFSFTTFSKHNPKVVDTSQIPGGYGIYRLPYTTETSQYAEKINDYTTWMHQIHGIDADSLAMVYPLDPSVYFLDLTLSSDQSRLILHTRETVDGTPKYVVTVIEEATMETLQRLETDWPENDTGDFYLYTGDGFFAAVINSQYLFLFTENTENESSYHLEYTGHMYSETCGDILFWVYDSANLQMTYDSSSRRLAIVMLMDENPTRTAFYLAVFEPSGLAYYGSCFSSLGAAPLGTAGSLPENGTMDLYSQYGEYDAEYLCTPAGSSPLSICWK